MSCRKSVVDSDIEESALEVDDVDDVDAVAAA